MTNRKTQEKITVVHLTTYPPRECGIATFSDDLITYSDELFSGKIETKVVALNTSSTKVRDYPKKVIFQISENNKEDYIKGARLLNEMPEVKVVSIQHEFGIFGENFGENLIYFLQELKKPTTITFHTVLSDPPEGMKSVMEGILELGEYFVVMTELSKKTLIEVYGVMVEKIKVIPHGIHPKPYGSGEVAKASLNLDNKVVLSTFGLLGRGKGIEYAILALPEIVKKNPSVVYLVLGATHPVILEREGEIYRNELLLLAKKLGVENNIMFHNKYLSVEELLVFLQATDIYLSLSTDPNQTVSGTLSYALGAGRPVISTAFMQAKEIISDEVGRLIDFKNHKSISQEVLNLLGNRERLTHMGKAAYFHTRNMTWPNVALAYMSMFSSMLPEISAKNKYMLPIKIDHLKRLTDDFGILQFASLSDPDPKWGYTLDDNARALVALCWYKSIFPEAKVEKLIKIYLEFIGRAAKEKIGFVNYFDEKRNPYDQDRKSENFEDANARAIWALAVAGRSNINEEQKNRALSLFEKELALHRSVSSPRAAAFYIKAFAEYNPHAHEDNNTIEQIKIYADFLVNLFNKSSDSDWQWFEDKLTYSNAILPEALLITYNLTEEPIYFDIAKKSLDFLLNQSFEGDVCVPIGQGGWFKKGGKKERYDQQPEEVSALVLALHKMILFDDSDFYRRKMVLAFDWFLGNNVSKQFVYMHSTGGCYDGIGQHSINLNQGSESTISYLLARLSMEQAKE